MLLMMTRNKIIKNHCKSHPDVKEVQQGVIAYEEKSFPELDTYRIGGEKNDRGGYMHVMTDEEVNPEDIDLSSFDIKDELNPKFWKNEKLDSRIRMKLLDIADDFIDFLEVNWVKPEDITMTGSLSNYNWSDFSDVDLHIIIDYSKVDEKTKFVKNYFNSKKELWNRKHENLKIYGFPVEVYVQDKNESHSSSGVYSLEKNKWIVKPSRKNMEEKFNDSKVRDKSAYFMNLIDDIVSRFKENSDEYQNKEILNSLNDTFDDIKDMRKKGFENGGKEMNDGNISFKVMRRNGYLDKISDLKGDIYDKINSLD